MFTVVFEVRPAPGKREYLDLAKHLKPTLKTIDGFIDNERFGSMRHHGWVLSLSTWRDEKAVVRWRTQGEHYRIQEQGRNSIFSDYHLRVCEVTADTHPPEGLEIIEQRLDATEIGDAKALAITELSPATDATITAHPDALPGRVGLDVRSGVLADYDVFGSIYSPGKMLLLSSWKTAKDSDLREPRSFSGVAKLRHRRVRNVRYMACSNAGKRHSTIRQSEDPRLGLIGAEITLIKRSFFHFASGYRRSEF